MRRIRNQNGVTLVALVVTIIVLIILAGISINLVLGDNGIVTIAKKAKQNTELAKIQEEKELNELYTQLTSENINSENLPYNSIEKLTEFKTAIATAITNKGIRTSKDDTLETFVRNIEKINTTKTHIVKAYSFDYETTNSSSQDLDYSFLAPEDGKLIVCGGSFFYDEISLLINNNSKEGILIEDNVGNGRKLMNYIEDVKEGDEINVSSTHTTYGNCRGTNIIVLLVRECNKYTILNTNVTNGSSENLSQSFSIPNDGNLIVIGWSCGFKTLEMNINNETKIGKLVEDKIGNDRKLIAYIENVKEGDEIDILAVASSSMNSRGASAISILFQ